MAKLRSMHTLSRRDDLLAQLDAAVASGDDKTMMRVMEELDAFGETMNMATSKDLRNTFNANSKKDETVERPSYQWALKMVRVHYAKAHDDAKGDTMKAITADIARLLVERIKPLARKVRT